MRYGWSCLAPLLLAAATGLAEMREYGGGDRYLSLKANTAALFLPMDDWRLGVERVRPDGQVVYYLFSSERRKTTLSLYINGVPSCRTPDACLELSLTNDAYAQARDLTRGATGPFKFAHFWLDRPMGAPVQQTHVLASAVVGGHWFDVHLSSVGNERPDPAGLLKTLGAISFR